MPTWEQFMMPALRVLSDAQLRSRRELFALVADEVALPAELRDEMLNSGQPRYVNRIGWALSGLSRAGAIVRPQRGRNQITDLGRSLLAQYPNGLTEKDLREIPAYRDYVPVERTAATQATATEPAETSLDPVEQIAEGYERLKTEVAAQLLERLRALDPAFLEQAVLDVLVAMGYGGADKRAQRIGGTGDGGVDGVIDQDALGLDQIYVQAKRYAADNIVSRETIQAFVGALHGRNASRGVFITTSRFSPGAVDFARHIGSRVILIDGARLADLMIRYRVGVQAKDTYAVVSLDEDYFE